VNEDTVDEMLSNFESKKYGIDLALDENHDPDHKAL
jgi:hypothetical protein